MSFPDMKDVQQEGCNRAVATAEGMGFPLDFTAESVQTLDRILGALHDAYIRTKNDEGYRGLSVMFAAYLVEVIERNFGRGRWERSHPALGQGSFPFYWNGAMLLPVEWCQSVSTKDQRRTFGPNFDYT